MHRGWIDRQSNPPWNMLKTSSIRVSPTCDQYPILFVIGGSIDSREAQSFRAAALCLVRWNVHGAVKRSSSRYSGEAGTSHRVQCAACRAFVTQSCSTNVRSDPSGVTGSTTRTSVLGLWLVTRQPNRSPDGRSRRNVYFQKVVESDAVPASSDSRRVPEPDCMRRLPVVLFHW